MDRLETLLTRAAAPAPEDKSEVGVLFVDLDGFRRVNDTMGHDAGDEALKFVARRLRELARPHDVVARLRGDEFVVLAPQTNSREVAAFAERLVEAMRQPFLVKSQLGRFVTLSVGATTLAPGSAPNEALAQAEAAMRHAKKAGRDQAAVYDPTSGGAVNRWQVAAEELRAGLQAGEIAPWFQPVFELAAAGEPVLHGFEALARWRHPTRGLVPPGDFIALAEEANLIAPLGRSILRQALSAMRSWPDPRLVVAVNVSAQQLVADGFAEETLNELLELGLPPQRLCLEITESLMMHSPERSLGVLHRLSEAGVAIAIDDFGSGFSSLAYVRNLPAAVLKIDRSFVAGLPENPKDRAVVKATVELAHALGMRIVAEGVETAAQLEHLKREGADFVQGYLLGRPQPLESLSFAAAPAVTAAA
jgi:diguanylate cyclase (GGDEF)-like protein